MKKLSELQEAINKPIPIGEILKTLNKAKKHIIVRPLNRDKIASIIEDALNTKWDIVISSDEHKNVEQGDMNINAFYNFVADEVDETAIELVLMFSPEDKELTIGEDGWSAMSSRLADAIQHEMHHQIQYRNRGFRLQRKFTRFNTEVEAIMKGQEYLGNDDEIEAFALNIANELVRSQGGKKEAIQALKTVNKKNVLKMSVNLFSYMTVFGFDMRHTVIKKLFKKIVLFINSST